MLATWMAILLVAQNPEPKAQRQDVATPEQAIRTFIVAMMTKDSKALHEVALPANDLDSLLQGQAVPPEAVEGFKAQIASLPVRVLKAGEEVTLPDGRRYKAKPEDVTPERAVVLPQGASFPALSRKVDGRWRIDAAPIIASMKGAAPKPLDPAQIKEKVTIKLDQKLDIQFTQKGDVISALEVVQKPRAGSPAVHVEFSKQDDNLMLVTQNPFPKNLSFRALARYKGGESYMETSIVPVRAGIFGIETWRDPIEELVLFDFKLVDDKP